MTWGWIGFEEEEEERLWYARYELNETRWIKKTSLTIHGQEEGSKPQRDADKAHLTFSNREIKCLGTQLARIIQGSK